MQYVSCDYHVVLLGLYRLTTRVPKSYSFNPDSVAVSYRTRDNDVKMTSSETTNGGVRSNGGGRDYARVWVLAYFLYILFIFSCCPLSSAMLCRGRPAWIKSKSLIPAVVEVYYHGQMCNRSNVQGPPNLYSRDCKFSATFKSGTEKASILMTWCRRIYLPKSKLNTELFKMHILLKNAPYCRFAHIFHKFYGVNLPDRHNWKEQPPFPYPLRLSIIPLLQSLRCCW